MTQDLSGENGGQLEEMATLGGGCFWCLEAVYVEMRGVLQVVSGYAGGSVPNPTYRAVCGGSTGHAEVVRVTFDPAAITYSEILQAFFATHDPTTLNRQGADVGTQYRSTIYFHSAEQKETADVMISKLNAADIWPDPIVTGVGPLDVFYPAEDYHQDYYKYNSQQPYCQAVITPKLAKFRKSFIKQLKD